MTDLLLLYRERLKERSDVGEKTRARYLEHADYIAKTWPGFEKLRPDEITRSAVESWRDRALKTGTGHRPPGAKSETTAVSGRSAGSFNKSVDALRRMLDIAVERGAISSNPIAGRGLKAKDKPRKPHLPDTKVLLAIFAEIERGSGIAGQGIEVADFCRFLAFTGCRLKEAGAVTWADVDWARGIVRVAGTKSDAAAREVPMIPAARALLERILARRKASAEVAVDGQPFVEPAARVLGVSEAAKSLARACAVAKVPKLTHHDLRDAFATLAIEAGVDIPTVAAWLGHVDGGALLMRTYAHHRRAHSVAQAAKVNFGGAL
jgi:integrase